MTRFYRIEDRDDAGQDYRLLGTVSTPAQARAVIDAVHARPLTGRRRMKITITDDQDGRHMFLHPTRDDAWVVLAKYTDSYIAVPATPEGEIAATNGTFNAIVTEF